jgi:hypothetical protein
VSYVLPKKIYVLYFIFAWSHPAKPNQKNQKNLRRYFIWCSHKYIFALDFYKLNFSDNDVFCGILLENAKNYSNKLVFFALHLKKFMFHANSQKNVFIRPLDYELRSR